jgi:hypothetical protein
LNKSGFEIKLTQDLRLVMEPFEPIHEMRKFPRYPVDLRIKINFKKDGVLQRATVRTIEIATHGVSVSSPMPLPEGSQVELEISLPGSRTPLRVVAMIRNKNGTRYGVEFLSTTDTQRYEIAQFTVGRKSATAAGPSIPALPHAN